MFKNRTHALQTKHEIHQSRTEEEKTLTKMLSRNIRNETIDPCKRPESNNNNEQSHQSGDQTTVETKELNQFRFAFFLLLLFLVKRVCA